MRVALPVPFVDTAARRLVFSLDAPPQEPLAVLDTTVADARVRLAVLGSSHQVIVRVREDSVSELVACRTGDGRTAVDAEGDLPPAFRHRSGGVHYDFRSSVRVLSDEALASAVRELDRLETRDDALVARFPGHPLAVTALEVLGPAVGAVVGWRTWHAYPQTGELVATRSEVWRP